MKVGTVVLVLLITLVSIASCTAEPGWGSRLLENKKDK